MRTRNLEVKGSVPYWGMLKNLDDTSKLELIALLSSSVAQKPAKQASTRWASRFAGAWQDQRSAEEIIEDIREARTANREVEL